MSPLQKQQSNQKRLFITEICKKGAHILNFEALKTECQKEVYSFPLHLSLKLRQLRIHKPDLLPVISVLSSSGLRISVP